MRLGKIAFALVALLILGGAAFAQVEANRLCLHNGSEYYSNAGWMPHTSINDGAGGYFPSFTHWASTQAPSGDYDWKLRGYAWGGMQGNNYGCDWYWGKILQASVDNPYATTMTFDYPALYCLGTVPHAGHPWVVYGGTQTNLTAPFDYKDMSFPSSFGGFDDYINAFTYAATAWYTSSVTPFYGWNFAFLNETSGMTYLASGVSIYQYTFENFNIGGQGYAQYQLLSGNEMDCTQLLGGNKGKNYYLGSVGDTNWFFYSNNSCTGGQNAWAMCLFLEDAVTFPVNRPGATNGSNPYQPDGFDTGVATVCPNMSSTQWSFQALYEDYDSAGDSYFALASLPSLGTQGWKNGMRFPGRWSNDPVRALFFQLKILTTATVQAGFTACMFGTTTGAISPFPIPFYDLIAKCLELRMWSVNFSQTPEEPSAGFMFTLF